MSATGPDYVSNTWNKFVEDYDYAKKFGLDALQAKIERELSLKPVQENDVRAALFQNRDQVNNDFAGLLQQAHKARKPHMGAYAKQELKDVNKDVDNALEQGRQAQMPQWPGIDKIDFSVAINRFVRDINKPDANITNVFDKLKADLKNKLKNERKLIMAPKMAPKAAPTYKPGQ